MEMDFSNATSMILLPSRGNQVLILKPNVSLYAVWDAGNGLLVSVYAPYDLVYG